ncbi:hypothetical protein AD998_07565 [bacterium 336/3]|nr:hypothetical protein AD998_07565 [bacterium 336/3]
MIRINKSLEPNILQTNKVAWTTELLDYISNGKKIPKGVYNRYNHSEVKVQLKMECFNKCMYCESVVAHVSHEHIEHIRPKAKDKFPSLTYEWNNLGLSCPVCNMNKGDEYDINLPFINPYIESPEDFIIALGAYIFHKPSNPKGDLTIRILKLNRPDLLERRLERIKVIHNLIDRYVSQTNPILKQAIKDELDIEVSQYKEYYLCVKSLYNSMVDDNQA